MVRPSLLLLDEVLAVGDLSFREKCEREIRTLCRQGTTIVLVSHNTNEIKRFCDRAIWIKHGHVMRDGPCESVIAQYLADMESDAAARV